MDEFDVYCDLEYIDWLSTVDNIEKVLQIDAHESRIEGIGEQDLEIAAEMILYLSSCPKKSLLIFYMDLLQNHSPAQIVLTLNRIINGGAENELKKTAQKLFNRLANTFSMKFNDFTTGFLSCCLKHNFRICMFRFQQHVSSSSYYQREQSNISFCLHTIL